MTPGFLGNLVILTEIIFCSCFCAALTKGGKETLSLHTVFLFLHIFPATTTSATVKMYSNVVAKLREKVNTLFNLLFCYSIFSDICNYYKTLFLNNLIVLLFRTVFCGKCFMDVFVFLSTTALKAVVTVVLLGRFNLWKVFALEPSEISSNILFCHQSHKQPHTMSTSHSERSFVSFLLIPVIFLSFKSVALLDGSKDPKPVTRCY